VSGHKFIGCPVPVGIVLSRKSICKSGEKIEYVGGFDATVSGSRSGLGAILIWKELKKRGMQGLAQRAARCLEMTLYTIARLEEVGVSAWAHPYSNTVVFPRPSEKLIKKWHLASQGDISHVILMPGITTKIIDEFVDDLRPAMMAGGR
jgi:histidine decarboxylase